MLGSYIKYMRKSRYYTQRELAKKLFIAPCTLSHYENGTRMVPYNTFLLVLEICNYKIDIIDLKSGKNITNLELVRLSK